MMPSDKTRIVRESVPATTATLVPLHCVVFVLIRPAFCAVGTRAERACHAGFRDCQLLDHLICKSFFAYNHTTIYCPDVLTPSFPVQVALVCAFLSPVSPK